MSKLGKILLIVFSAVALCATSAAAQTIDKKVYFTFSGPVEIPGATLPAGKYLFHLADPDSGRQVPPGSERRRQKSLRNVLLDASSAPNGS